MSMQNRVYCFRIFTREIKRSRVFSKKLKSHKKIKLRNFLVKHMRMLKISEKIKCILKQKILRTIN